MARRLNRASVGIEQFDKWKYICTIMRLKGGREGAKQKEENETRVKKRNPRRRRKYFHKIRGDDAFEEKPMLVLVR